MIDVAEKFDLLLISLIYQVVIFKVNNASAVISFKFNRINVNAIFPFICQANCFFPSPNGFTFLGQVKQSRLIKLFTLVSLLNKTFALLNDILTG